MPSDDSKSLPPSQLLCPRCGAVVQVYRNPLPAVDVIIELEDEFIVLIDRKNPPLGWALPGGFVEHGETVENAALREAKEETGLDVNLLDLVGVYSDPARDPRRHTLSVVFAAKAQGRPRAGDDAADSGLFKEHNLPHNLAFDHRRILQDYYRIRRTLSRCKRIPT
ncbi:MAG: NUDIX hydrolase [Deltaproteobacteria bacterium]|nr:NUDIX hydrolase [Deltaproteobacteria bacterium]